jgi:hypothetical protein
MKVVKIIEINKETVIISYGIDRFCIHNFGDKHKTKFEKFKQELTENKHIEISEVFRLVTKYQLKMVYKK